MDDTRIDRLLNAIRKHDAESPSGAEMGPDIDPNITIAEDIAYVLDKDDPQRRRLLQTVARALRSRFERFNEWHDLERAIDFLQELIESTDEDDDVNVASLCHDYAKCLQNRFMRGRNSEDLENAISFAKRSVETSRTLDAIDRHSLAERLDTLSFLYFTKSDQVEHTCETLDQAITCSNEARDLTRSDGSSTTLNCKILHNLSMYLLFKFEHSPQDSFSLLEESILLGRLVIEKDIGTPEDRATCLRDHALRLLKATRYYLQHQDVIPDFAGQTYLDEAVDLMHQSTTTAKADPVNHLFSTLSFVLDAEKFPKKHQGHVLRLMDPLLRQALDLLPQTALTVLRNDQRDLLSALYGLSRYAAAAALENRGEPFEALQLLERGRGIGISMHLDSSPDLAYLKTNYPELECKYSAIRQELQSDKFAFKRREERVELVKRLEDVRGLIQEKPGLEEFDKVMGKAEMKKLAVEGPIITINITNFRSDALVITIDGIRAIPIPYMDEEMLSERSWELQWRLVVEDDIARAEVFADLHRKLLRDLALLWRILMKPLLQELGYTKASPDPPRVWWIPTGVLSLFPLHAAGDPKSGQGVLQYVVSSYSPSLKALAQARLVDARRKQDWGDEIQNQLTNTALVVSMDETPNMSILPQSHAEVSAVQSLFRNAEILSRPCRMNVLEALKKRHSVVHFTCHGETIYENPFDSRLLLSDWEETPFTVADLLRQDLRGSQLAFLSICFAANAGVENEQDESIHLASAFQVAGFSSVVGSLWYVTEEAALQVAQDFYEYFQKRGGFDVRHAARALHQAILRLQDTTKDEVNERKGDPVIWTPFVHFGI